MNFHIGWPQAVFTIWALFWLLVAAAWHGDAVRISFLESFLFILLATGLLWWGGFFS